MASVSSSSQLSPLAEFATPHGRLIVDWWRGFTACMRLAGEGGWGGEELTPVDLAESTEQGTGAAWFSGSVRVSLEASNETTLVEGGVASLLAELVRLEAPAEVIIEARVDEGAQQVNIRHELSAARDGIIRSSGFSEFQALGGSVVWIPIIAGNATDVAVTEWV